jgi:steroid delta-isomerase-like uncharacterized protein
MATDPKTLVERFYGEVWNRGDETVAREILQPALQFRGSLGVERQGIDEFLRYMREVHSALADYRCAIDELITTESRAAARMLFTGTHRGVLFGIPPTGRVITWAGAAFFTIVQGQITRIWVIGDIEGVKRQLGAGAANSF